MRLVHPLLAIGVLILEALLIWWAIGQMEPTEATAGDVVVAVTPVMAKRWVVWYGEDGRVHRQQVDAEAYTELQRSLRQVREEDLQRLIGLAAGYLRVDLQPVFTELSARGESFLVTLFDFGTSSALLGAALTAAEKVRNPESGAEKEKEPLDSVREATAEEVVSRFRAQLLVPETTLRALRAAAGRSLALLRQDLLQDCDRYDRAFRGFVLESTTTMETLDATAGWQVDIAWRPETATFRSLCVGLRHTDPGVYLAESMLLETFTKADPPLRTEALELVRPIAETALELNKYSEDTTDSFSKWGLSRSWAHPPALLVSYVAHTKILARRVGERMNVRYKRPHLRETLRGILEQLQTDLTDRLKRTCNEFITAELGRVELGLAARGEGVWSTP
ncbi:conserved hypothetical protein [Gammaproteobacteria bacterium]